MHSSSVYTLFNLPPEILVHIINGSHIKFMLNLSKVHPYFKELIEHNSILWQNCSFQDSWPCPRNLKHFENAANKGNFEALIKLGIAYLYNEGLSGDLEGKRMQENGKEAARIFCTVDKMSSSPFTWLFVRPPWSAKGACCKQMVFNCISSESSKNEDPHVTVTLGRIYKILWEDGKIFPTVEDRLRRLKSSSPHVAYFLWYHAQNTESWTDRQNIQELRAIQEFIPEARLELCCYYARGQYGGLNKTLAAQFVKSFLQDTKPTFVSRIYRTQALTHSMRYILTDWLVEVCNMKDYGSRILHSAINLVDRVLKARQISRARLQLLGVSAIVICSRLLGTDIITIREAAWLTDNTYKYEDVVRMMGEITTVVRGQFRELTSFDYLEVVNHVARSSGVCRLLSEYICEMSVLQSDLGEMPRAAIAAACVLLARVCLHQDNLWPSHMEAFTGFSLANLRNTTAQLHRHCFCGPPMTDHRGVELTAVKYKYEDLVFMAVSGIPMVSEEKLYELLGLSFETTNKSEVWPPEDIMNSAFISSPCRPTSPHDLNKSLELWAERDDTATPTMDQKLGDQLNDLFNRSFSLAQAEVDERDVEDSEQAMMLDLHCEDVYNWASSCEGSPVLPSEESDDPSTTECSPEKTPVDPCTSSEKSCDDMITNDRENKQMTSHRLNVIDLESAPVDNRSNQKNTQLTCSVLDTASSESHIEGKYNTAEQEKEDDVLHIVDTYVNNDNSNYTQSPKGLSDVVSNNKPALILLPNLEGQSVEGRHDCTNEFSSSKNIGEISLNADVCSDKPNAWDSFPACDSLPKAANKPASGGGELVTPLDKRMAVTKLPSDIPCDSTSLEDKQLCDGKQTLVKENIGLRKCEQDATHSTPKCGSSPGTVQPPIGISPIGGLSCFKIEGSVGRLISTSMKIDFENKSSKDQYICTSRSELTTTCCPSALKSDTNKQGFQMLIEQQTPCSKLSKTGHPLTGLRLRDTNVMSENSYIEKCNKKRRPSGHLENERKKQLTQTDAACKDLLNKP